MFAVYVPKHSATPFTRLFNGFLNFLNQRLTTLVNNATIVTSMQLQGLRRLPGKDKGDFQMEKTIGAWEARRRFGQLIEEAFYNKDYFVVE